MIIYSMPVIMMGPGTGLIKLMSDTAGWVQVSGISIPVSATRFGFRFTSGYSIPMKGLILMM